MTGRELTIGDRVFSIYEEGNADGPVILIHHGTPSAGLPFGPWVEDAIARGARLVGYDRPGYGSSSPAPGRSVADAALDCGALMDVLGVERFVTWGISGGGPHALACAAMLGERVAAAASLGGVAPFDAPGLNYFRGMGEDNISEFGLTLAGRRYCEPAAEKSAAEMLPLGGSELAESIASLVSPVDREVLDGAIGDWWEVTLKIAFASGVEGWVEDDLAFAAPFGFEVGAITVPTLIVHGVQDQFVPVDHGRWLAQAIPSSEARLDEGDGHLTVLANGIPAVHDWLLAHL